MGTIILSSQKSTDPAPFTYTVSIPDEDLDRMIAAWAPVLFPGNENVTGAEVFAALTERVVDRWKGETEGLLRTQAAEAASAAVVPLTVTPAV